MLEGKKVIIFDMDGTLIDSVGIWNQVDEELITRIRSEGTPLPENVQSQRDEALRRFSKAESPYMEYCAFLKEKYDAVQSPDEIHTLRYEIAQEFLQNVIDYKPDADTFLRLRSDLPDQYIRQRHRLLQPLFHADLLRRML